MTRRWLARAGLTAALAVLVACGGGGGNSGAQWPSVTINGLDGAEVASASVVATDRPTVVAIWATWCVPCKTELPRLQQLAADDPAVAVAAVNLGDEAAAVASFRADLGLTLPMYIDDKGLLSEALGVASVPATVFVAADGTIVERHAGALSAEELAAGVARVRSQATSGA